MARTAVYLDHNASTPLLPEAREALLATIDLVGNPSSVHAHGRALADSIEKARAQIAALAGAERRQVVFTGSASEAITQAIVGGVSSLGMQRVIISGGEHAAVREAAKATRVAVVTVGLDADGHILVGELRAALQAADAAGERALVAVHAVNNETGVVQPTGTIAALVGPTPHFLFIDAVQALGKLPLEFSASPADMMAVSAHKIGGPIGVGALLVKGHCDAVRLIPGGGQEQGRRGGTQSAALIAAFGAAAAAFVTRYDAGRIAALVERLETQLHGLAPDVVVFGGAAERLGNVIDFAVPGLTSAVAMMGLDLAGISVSSGSACSSGKVAQSHVLSAMGVPDELARCALRVSLGWNSTAEEVEAFLGGLKTVLARHRGRHGLAA